MQTTPTTLQHPGKPALRGRLGRGAVVIGAHVALIYAVAASLGIVRSPLAVEPLQAVMIDAPAQPEKPVQVVKPDRTPPTLAGVALPEPGAGTSPTTSRASTSDFGSDTPSGR